MLAERYKPDVALVDLFLGEESGAEVCQQLRERSPTTKVLLISGAGRISPEAASAAGAAGFIPKDWGAADIARAVRMVGLGMTVFQPQVDDGAAALTQREREVLDLIARGATNREIAAALHLSPHTIHEHTAASTASSARATAPTPCSAPRAGLRPDRLPPPNLGVLHPPPGGSDARSGAPSATSAKRVMMRRACRTGLAPCCSPGRGCRLPARASRSRARCRRCSSERAS